MKTRKLLVYGTLRKGERLHYYIKSAIDKFNGKFLGIAKLKGYEMYSNGFYPYVVKSRTNKEGFVFGEVYEFKDCLDTSNLFLHLDMIEHGYDRKSLKVNLENAKRNISVEVYVYPIIKLGNKSTLIKSGDWKNQN